MRTPQKMPLPLLGLFWSALHLGTCVMAAPDRSVLNPVLETRDDLRDPAVVVTDQGYRLFFSRLKGAWSNPESWTIGTMLTRDFRTFTDDHDVTSAGFASPGDVIYWHGRYILPYQSYPEAPSQLCYSTSADLRRWSPPTKFLNEAAALPWNTCRRAIDPSLVVDGNTLHCFFVGSADLPDLSGKSVRVNMLGHATTTDSALQRWTILTTKKPLFAAAPGAPDGVENVMVFGTDHHWMMIYSEGLAHQHLAHAVSTDLVRWTPEGRIELPPQRWMNAKYGAPYVWRERGGWWMLLMGETNLAPGVSGDRGKTTLGLLFSRDAVSWTPLPERTAFP